MLNLRGVDEATDEADAIVVGSGINGLASAAELAPAGWSVILLERNAEIGGLIANEERTLLGYLDDTFSSWHPLFVSGPAYAASASCCTGTGSSTETLKAGPPRASRHARAPGPRTAAPDISSRTRCPDAGRGDVERIGTIGPSNGAAGGRP